MDLGSVMDIQDDPDGVVNRGMDEVGERTVSLHRDGDPATDRRIIGPPLTDEGG